ncbi:nuclear transport factor 2 family protein [Variovorax sp. J31P207]|uniref:nuclear transport factor 2 family protein n=1 Tax=Variovorax sp. J31P207 TaxID=3053510 RepID=UPI0025790FB1|nr:nuclear transport factor 2 family protein [Variovorax sp. J31P207]MDM0065871.1 nuclear transport factor 2 family protein [Variovorax sp. J31P207]
MSPTEQTLRRFYDAFARLDADTMAACYAPDACFDDEAFSLRGGREVGGMWKMLCSGTQAKGASVWKLSYRDVEADAAGGKAHWDAHYLFSATGRIVDNAIDSRFTFTPEGLIATQRDRFDFWRWSRQALGAPGLLLGWSPMLKKKVRATAAANLQAFLARNP